MNKIIEKQIFRSKVVLKLLDIHELTTDELISSAKKIEDYVFQENLTYLVAGETNQKMLDGIVKGFLEQRKRAFKDSEIRA